MSLIVYVFSFPFTNVHHTGLGPFEWLMSRVIREVHFLARRKCMHVGTHTHTQIPMLSVSMVGKSSLLLRRPGSCQYLPWLVSFTFDRWELWLEKECRKILRSLLSLAKILGLIGASPKKAWWCILEEGVVVAKRGLQTRCCYFSRFLRMFLFRLMILRSNRRAISFIRVCV